MVQLRVIAIALLCVFLIPLNSQAQGFEERYSGTLQCPGGNETVQLHLHYNDGLTAATGDAIYQLSGRRGTRNLVLRSDDGTQFTATGEHAGSAPVTITRSASGYVNFQSPADYCPGQACLDLQRGSIDTTKFHPLPWIGKRPDTVIDGRTFWDVLELTSDEQTDAEYTANWNALIEGCTFEPVTVDYYVNNDTLSRISHRKFIVATEGTCSDGRIIKAYSERSGLLFAHTDLPSERDRVVTWRGNACLQKPDAESFFYCDVQDGGLICHVERADPSFSCASPAPEIERRISFRKQLQSEPVCRQEWNLCANPVWRPEDSVFGSCMGASGAYETVCSGGPGTASLIGPPTSLTLPEELAFAQGAAASTPLTADTMIEVLDASTGHTILVPAGRLAEQRLQAAEAERLAAQKREEELEAYRKAYAANRAAEKAEEEARHQAELEAERAELDRMLKSGGVPAPLAGYAQFTMTAYVGQVKEPAGKKKLARNVRPL
ncbi:MAG: hypothetical protein R3C13_03985 [Hyphomonas sp.]|uniref:hypothetical protein n=1 Tax=Hyphomonas sp. TaxID=87 RepID=UPI003527765D